MRDFGGLSVEETADILRVSPQFELLLVFDHWLVRIPVIPYPKQQVQIARIFRRPLRKHWDVDFSARCLFVPGPCAIKLCKPIVFASGCPLDTMLCSSAASTNISRLLPKQLSMANA
jgi:hypothetical protein